MSISELSFSYVHNYQVRAEDLNSRADGSFVVDFFINSSSDKHTTAGNRHVF